MATYQWLETRKRRSAVQTEPTLTRANTKPSDASRYTVRVANASGTSTSAPAIVSIK
jgi:hypothetical protein